MIRRASPVARLITGQAPGVDRALYAAQRFC
jgi:hypothetical protein